MQGEDDEDDANIPDANVVVEQDQVPALGRLMQQLQIDTFVSLVSSENFSLLLEG